MALIGDFNPALGITLNGDDVSLWENQGSSGNVDQTTAINQPEFIPSAINGHAALRFGGSEFLEALNGTDFNLGLNNLTMALVFAPTVGTVQRICGKAEGNTGGVLDGYHTFLSSAGARLTCKNADGNGRRGWNSSGDVINDAVINITTYTFNNTTKVATLFHDNVDVADVADNFSSMSTSMDTTESFKIGQVGTATTSRFVGDLYRALIWDSLENEADEFAILDALYNNPLVTSTTSPLISPIISPIMNRIMTRDLYKTS